MLDIEKKQLLKIIRDEIISAKTWKVDETIVREKKQTQRQVYKFHE